MTDFFQTPRIELPDDWQPEGVVCLSVPVPDDPQYFAMVVGLLDQLRWSKTFARDPTKAGAATVARTWAAALNTRPIVSFDCEELDMSFDLRTKPGEPWTMQASTDNGLTWHDALIQAHWESGIVSPPIASPEVAADWSAAFYQHFWINVITQISDGITAGDTQDETVAHIMDQLGPYGAGASMQQALNNAYDAFEAVSPPDQPAYLTDCPYVNCFASLANYIDNNTNWLDGLNNFIVDHLQCLNDDLVEALNTAAATLGSLPLFNYVTNLGGVGGGGGGAGFGATCTWSLDYDFTISDGGWAYAPGYAFPYPTWVNTIGWRSDHPTPAAGEGGDTIQLDFTTPTVVDTVHMKADSTDSNPGTFLRRIELISEAGNEVLNVPLVPGITNNTFSPPLKIYSGIVLSYDEGTTGGAVAIIECNVTGRGAEPL